MSDGLLAEIVPLIPKMRAYAMVLTRSESDADDLLQDTLVRAWRFQHGFAPGTNLKAWLFRILRNEFLSRLEARKLVTVCIDGPAGEQLATLPDQEFNLQYGELLAGIQTLSDDTRQALLLTVGAGFTYAQAAEVCGCPIGTIKSRVSRARDLLMHYLDGVPKVGWATA